MRMLYKYPQAAFPYSDLVDENRRRGRGAPEYELVDTGVFDGDRYFDVFVEYAKVDSEDLLMKITVANRGPEAAAIRVLPTIWFRNTWAWGGRSRRGRFEARPPVQGSATIAARDHALRPPLALRRGRSGAALHRERNQRDAVVRHRRPAATPRTASTRRSCTDAPTR